MNIPAEAMPNELMHLQKMHNGQKVVDTFSAVEMQRRQDGLRRILEDMKLDAALLTSCHSINYYSVFLYCCFGRRYAFVVTDERAVSVSAGIDAGQPWRRTFGDDITYTDWRRDDYVFALQQELAGCRRIGIEFDHVSLDFRRLLDEAFPGVEFVDIAQATMWMRTVKSAEEIALIKEGARTADLGGEAIRAAIAEGVPEYEIALAGTQAMVRHIGETFPDVEPMDTWVWFPSGFNTDGAHDPVTTRRLQKGDILSLDCFPMIAGHLHRAGAHALPRSRRPAPVPPRARRSDSRPRRRGFAHDFRAGPGRGRPW